MEIPKQGVNTSTIAIDNFIFHPFSGHGSPRAVPLQLAAAHWPVKSGEHKSSIIASWYHSTQLCSHTVVHCKVSALWRETEKKKTVLPPSPLSLALSLFQQQLNL